MQERVVPGQARLTRQGCLPIGLGPEGDNRLVDADSPPTQPTKDVPLCLHSRPRKEYRDPDRGVDSPGPSVGPYGFPATEGALSLPAPCRRGAMTVSESHMKLTRPRNSQRAGRFLESGEPSASGRGITGPLRNPPGPGVPTGADGRRRPGGSASGVLRERWDDLSIDRRLAIIAAVLDHVEVGPGRRGYNRFDPNRFALVWRY